MAEEQQNNSNQQENESTESLLKKILYQGVAKASNAVEFVEKTVTKLVGENKITSEEGKKIIENFTSSFDSKVKDTESKIREVINGTLQNVRPATKSEVEELRKRVEALEKIVAGLD